MSLIEAPKLISIKQKRKKRAVEGGRRTFRLTRAISDFIGRPDLGRSSNDMSPSWNGLNQSRQLRSATASSPRAAHNLWRESLGTNVFILFFP